EAPVRADLIIQPRQARGALNLCKGDRVMRANGEEEGATDLNAGATFGTAQNARQSLAQSAGPDKQHVEPVLASDLPQIFDGSRIGRLKAQLASQPVGNGKRRIKAAADNLAIP